MWFGKLWSPWRPRSPIVARALDSCSKRWVRLRAPRLRSMGRQLDRPDLTDEQKFHKLGNDSADAAARQAAARRPRPSQAERDKLSRQQLIARLVCLLAADVMPMFPGLALCEVVRLKPPPAPEAPPGPRHVWHWEGRFWLCSGCWRSSRRVDRPIGGVCRGAPSIKG